MPLVYWASPPYSNHFNNPLKDWIRTGPILALLEADIGSRFTPDISGLIFCTFMASILNKLYNNLSNTI